MARRYGGVVLRDLSALWTGGSSAGVSDADLVARCAADDDRAQSPAFAALMVRHGPLVLGVCRRLLRDSHDVEDAFQATFLVLARMAGTIRVGETLGPWLYGVAYRVAVRLRSRARHRGLAGVEPVALDNPGGAEVDELRRLLHEEIGRLPEKYRAPVILCHLEGKSNEEAARVLRCPIGTVSDRLCRAREILRLRLGRRGLALPLGALLATLDTEAVGAGSASLHEAASRLADQLPRVLGQDARPASALIVREVSGTLSAASPVVGPAHSAHHVCGSRAHLLAHPGTDGAVPQSEDPAPAAAHTVDRRVEGLPYAPGDRP